MKKVEVLFETNDQIKVYFEDSNELLNKLLKAAKLQLSDCGTYRKGKDIIGYDLVVDYKHRDLIKTIVRDHIKEIKQLEKDKVKQDKIKQANIAKEKEKTKKLVEESLKTKERKKRGKI